jgi:hypothetical protein
MWFSDDFGTGSVAVKSLLWVGIPLEPRFPDPGPCLQPFFRIDTEKLMKRASLSRCNSPDSAGPARKLVLCVQPLSCVYISSVPVQQCVHLLSKALQQLCVHYLLNTVALKDFASWKRYFPPDPENWRKRQVCSRASNWFRPTYLNLLFRNAPPLIFQIWGGNVGFFTGC